MKGIIKSFLALPDEEIKNILYVLYKSHYDVKSKVGQIRSNGFMFTLEFKTEQDPHIFKKDSLMLNRDNETISLDCKDHTPSSLYSKHVVGLDLKHEKLYMRYMFNREYDEVDFTDLFHLIRKNKLKKLI